MNPSRGAASWRPQSLRSQVEALVADIPRGRVMTYGDIAAFIGHPGAGRAVGTIARTGSPGLPWQRVVGHSGTLAAGYGTGPEEQAAVLADDGVSCENNHVVDFATRRWLPE